MASNDGNAPPLAMAAWLLDGGSLTERVAWVIAHEFTGISLSQYHMKFEPQDRAEAAAAVKEADLNVTYHGNVGHKLTADRKLDPEFVDCMIDDVLWWHEHAGGVCCCCSDVIKYAGESGQLVCPVEENRRLLRTTAEGLHPFGIRTGHENNCAPTPFTVIDELNRLRRDFPGPMQGMLLDAGHANVYTRRGDAARTTDVGGYVRRVPFEILDVHLSDNRGTKDEHKPIGSGNLDLHCFFRALRKICFKGQLTLEVCLDAGSGKGSLINNLT